MTTLGTALTPNAIKVMMLGSGELGKEVVAHFGEEAAPLYERLAKFFQVLESYHFIKLNKDV